MNCFKIDGLTIALNKEGQRNYTKVTYPVRYGRYAEIQTREFTFQFNLNGEIKYILPRQASWPGPNEWLKRTAGDDWIYYAASGYTLIHSLTGEHYLPCLPYPSNSLFQHNPFNEGRVEDALMALADLQAQIETLPSGPSENMPEDLQSFLAGVVLNTPEILSLRAKKFHDIIGGRIPVLPPDARHVDYDVIPLTLTEGCLYNCHFCKIKTGQRFEKKTQKQIREQISALKTFYNRDLANHAALFLGGNDALAAGADTIEFSAMTAYEHFRFQHAHIKGPYLFLFGSVESIKRADDRFFTMLSRLPYYTSINVGLESVDQETLDLLKKPIDVPSVKETFSRMLEINRRHQNIEMSANFLMGPDLPRAHLPSIEALAIESLDHYLVKGSLYFSPLLGAQNPLALRKKFADFKKSSRLPAYLYLIQRL